MVEFKENDTSTEDIEIYLYQQLVQKRKKTRVRQIILSRALWDFPFSVVS